MTVAFICKLWITVNKVGRAIHIQISMHTVILHLRKCFKVGYYVRGYMVLRTAPISHFGRHVVFVIFCS